MVNVYCILSNTSLDILLLCISTTSRSIVFEVTHKLQSVLNCVLDKSLNLYKPNVQYASRKVRFRESVKKLARGDSRCVLGPTESKALSAFNSSLDTIRCNLYSCTIKFVL